MSEAPVAELLTKLSDERHRSVPEGDSSRSGGADSGLVARTNVRVGRRDNADDGGVKDVGGDDNTLSNNLAVEVDGVIQKLVHLVDGAAKVEELENSVRVSNRRLWVETFTKLLHENMRHALIHVGSHDHVGNVTSHDIEDGPCDLMRYGEAMSSVKLRDQLRQQRKVRGGESEWSKSSRRKWQWERTWGEHTSLAST